MSTMLQTLYCTFVASHNVCPCSKQRVNPSPWRIRDHTKMFNHLVMLHIIHSVPSCLPSFPQSISRGSFDCHPGIVYLCSCLACLSLIMSNTWKIDGISSFYAKGKIIFLSSQDKVWTLYFLQAQNVCSTLAVLSLKNKNECSYHMLVYYSFWIYMSLKATV